MENSNTQQQTDDPQATQLQQMLDLEQSIKTYFDSIRAKQEEIKQNRDMVKDAYLNDEAYHNHEEKVKEVKMAAEKTKEQIGKSPAVIHAKQKITEAATELKEMQKALSNFLLQYYKLTGNTHITVHEGEEYQIVQNAKLVKKKREE